MNIQLFKGTEKEKLQGFKRQLTICSQVEGIDDADRPIYLHLHLKGGAFTYFDQLPQVTRTDYKEITALFDRYRNDQRVQL